MHLKMSSAKWRPFCLGLNELRACDGYVDVHNPHTADTLRKNDVVITSKRRHCDVITSQ